jgi:hypothetical protein
MPTEADYVVTGDPSVASGVLVTAPESRPFDLHRLAWGAVLAGVALALVVHVILNMLGVGIGIATLDPGTRDNPSAGSFSIGAGIWFAVAGIVSAFAGGWLAARVSGKPLKTMGGLHGLTSWAVTTLIVVLVAGTVAGGLIGGVFRGMSGMVGGAVETAAQSVAPPGERYGEIDERIAGALGTTPGQARATAAEVADDAAAAASTAAILSVIALLLGALAAWLGGRMGTIRAVTVTTETVVRRNI